MIQYLSLKIGNMTPIEQPAGLPKDGTAPTIISNALTVFISIGIIISVIFAIWAGISWITSGGDKQKLAQARAKLTWAIIGLIIIFISFAIINIFSFMFNVNLLDFKI